MDALEALHDRVNALLRRHNAVLRERDDLRKELAAVRAHQETLREKLRHSEDELLAARIGNALPDEEARARSRRKLDEVIGEIDKILTALND